MSIFFVLNGNVKVDGFVFRFAAGYGLFIFINGIFAFVFGPIVGWIRDITQSYLLFYLSLQIVSGFCIIPWITELIWFKKSSKAVDN